MLSPVVLSPPTSNWPAVDMVLFKHVVMLQAHVSKGIPDNYLIRDWSLKILRGGAIRLSFFVESLSQGCKISAKWINTRVNHPQIQDAKNCWRNIFIDLCLAILGLDRASPSCSHSLTLFLSPSSVTHQAMNLYFTFLVSTLVLNQAQSRPSPETPPSPCLPLGLTPIDNEVELKKQNITIPSNGELEHVFVSNASLQLVKQILGETTTMVGQHLCTVDGSSSPLRDGEGRGVKNARYKEPDTVGAGPMEGASLLLSADTIMVSRVRVHSKCLFLRCGSGLVVYLKGQTSVSLAQVFLFSCVIMMLDHVTLHGYNNNIKYLVHVCSCQHLS